MDLHYGCVEIIEEWKPSHHLVMVILASKVKGSWYA